MTDEIAAAVRKFEEEYAERSGMTVRQLHDFGRYGAPCDCDYEECKGFQMVSPWEYDRDFDANPEFFRSYYGVNPLA